MKTILLVLWCALGALAAPSQFEPITNDYHRRYGIPQAARIKAAEESMDFDGSRIAGGSLSGLGAYPFMGGLVIALHAGPDSVCGSSLLSNTRLVTAAHCWRNGGFWGRQFTVVLGSTRLFSGGVRIVTNQVQMHPDYMEWNFFNDIAIIRIGHVGFNAHINRINLATGTNAFVGVLADVVGFGRTGNNHAIGPNQSLSHVRVPVIANAECQRTFGNVILSSTICTSGAGGRNPCPGDSGGPLAIPGPTLVLQPSHQLCQVSLPKEHPRSEPCQHGKKRLGVINTKFGHIIAGGLPPQKEIGVVSFGSPRGCQAGYPTAYARVSSFATWIRARL